MSSIAMSPPQRATMTPIQISIVVCTFNGVPYLQSQLDSLLAQTRLPDEIIVSDDGSTDSTMVVLETFASVAGKRGVQVRLFRNPINLGFVENFSSALQHANGDVLFLCDQDDVWRPDKLALVEKRFVDDPELLLLHSDARLVDAHGAPLGNSVFDALQMTAAEKVAIHRGNAFDIVMRRSFVTGATAAFRRELIDVVLPIAPDWIHDEWLAATVAALGKMDFIDQPLIDYRQHGGNQIGARKRTLLMKWRDVMLPRRKFLLDEVTRLRHLATFVARIRAPQAVARAAQVTRKCEHFERRIAIGQMPRYRRAPMVFREARTGDYGRYGTGVRSMLRDLLRHD